MPHTTDPRQGKDPSFRVLDLELFNAGPEPASLAGEFVTPVSRFFARSHGTVPVADPGQWRLSVAGLVRQTLQFSLEDLQRDFLTHTVTATLVCAGFRRTELIAHKMVPGELPWGLEPAGNAIWRGAALRDVLMACGVQDDALHVGLVGGDTVEREGKQFGFGGSIPIAKAITPEVLIAWEMNGEPLPALHGGPLRLVVPGYIGARSVKWLRQIELRKSPSENFFQTKAYRVLHTPDPDNPRDVTKGRALGENPLNSIILIPSAGQVLNAGATTVSGWAIGTNGAPLLAVEVSSDGGGRWIPAKVEPAESVWAWQHWTAQIKLAPGASELVVRARDAHGEQPADIAEVWNAKGYANTAWHRVPVKVVP